MEKELGGLLLCRKNVPKRALRRPLLRLVLHGACQPSTSLRLPCGGQRFPTLPRTPHSEDVQSRPVGDLGLAQAAQILLTLSFPLPSLGPGW